MLIDARTVDSTRRIEADICVIGTGPAGLTLLKSLARPGLRIVALESGSQEFDPEIQSLCEGPITSPDGYPATALTTSRRRQLGGTANLWNDELDAGEGNELVRLVPLDAIDFEKREWVPHSGWPFAKTELDRFYEQALDFVGAAIPGNELSQHLTNHPELFPLEARLATVLSRFAPRTVFTQRYSQAIASDPAVTVYFNATVLELALHNNAINSVRAASMAGQEFHVDARVFVLATGGIENARILLLSNRDQPNGIGNQCDLVGRYFMDHPSFRLGVLTPSRPDLFHSADLYDHHLFNGQVLMGKFTFRPETMRREQMLNICITLTPRGRDYESPAVTALKKIVRSKSKKDAARLLGREFDTLTNSWDELAARFYHKLAGTTPVYFENKGGWSRLSKPQRRFRRFELCCLAEQAPNPENRVSLTNELDHFGLRKAQLNWRWSEVDLRSIRRAQDLLKEEIDAQRLGTFVGQHELDEGRPPFVCSPHHHIGTTRMHADPRHGVVDADCRVHGVSNLYLAGSSVFPTAGFANPTLTIIALAIRLSYHLKKLMKPSPSSVSTSAAPPVCDGEVSIEK